MKFGIADLVAVLGFAPTDEQLAVITADLDQPVLVVAGAGSGKTTVMTARVIWAVAHGFVAPGEVLGLTFTTKAAAELLARMRTRLARLAELTRGSGMLAAPPEYEDDPLSLTYHSFAHRLVAEHGLRLGIEPDARLITEAELAQLAYQTVVDSRLNLSLISSRPAAVAGRLIELDGRLTEHSLTPAQLEAEDLATVAEIEGLGKVPQAVVRTRETCRARAELARLVVEFRAEKQRIGVLDFADLLRHGSTLADDHPAVGEYLRSQYRLVLLDEYQDTSAVQTRILARLFGSGHPVTAVGDPLQGIFGWRGASAQSISAFPREFASASGELAGSLTLRINHRSHEQILVAANRVAAPLRSRHPAAGELRPRAEAGHPGGAATPGVPQVRVGLFETHGAELDWLAAEIADIIAAGAEPGEIAVLCRTGADCRQVGTALTHRGVPVAAPSVEGLLAAPEVIEVLSVLRVIADPTDNRAVVRLLRGPRWRIGLRDLAILGRRAQDLAGGLGDATGDLMSGDGAPARGAGEGALSVAVAAAVRGTDPVDLPSLSEATANLGSANRYGYSAEARERLTDFAAELSRLRAKSDLPLPDLAAFVVSAVGLDLELAMLALRDRERLDPAGVTDQFIELTARFRALANEGGLHGFLTWIATVERLGARVDVVGRQRPHAVQVLTVHRAKGLEWDRVYVPFLSKGVFPGAKPSPSWLSDCAQLPHHLRGDRLALPGTPAHSTVGYGRFKEQSAAVREADERQLAYVALTRARTSLVGTGHWWGPTQLRMRGPSPYLLELRRESSDPAVVIWEPKPDDDAVNPSVSLGSQVVDRTGSAAAESMALADGAALASAPLVDAQPSEAERKLIAEWDAGVAACVAGLDGPDHPGGAPPPVNPGVWSASAALSMVRDPHAHLVDLRRPMPIRPSRQARDGVAFHSWIENYYGQGTIFDVAEPGEPTCGDFSDSPGVDFELLRDDFRSLEYAQRVPVAVEVPFTVVIASRVITGRIDAVFAAGSGWEVVDWKTGARPDADPLQLAIYRIAWSRLMNVAADRVSGSFVYVRLRRVERFVDLPDEEEIARRLRDADSSAQRPGVGR